VSSITERRISSGFQRLAGTMFLSTRLAFPSASISRPDAFVTIET
jgi:hypothetical protein